jgi:hypothetical protein
MIGPAPFSTPVCPGDKTSQAWNLHLRAWDGFLQEASRAGTAQAKEDPAQSLTYCKQGPFIAYQYQGLGGVSFDVAGHTITIPASTTPQLTKSFILAEG